MSGHHAILTVATVARTEQQHGRQGDPAAHGMHHNGAGKIMEFGTKGAFQPFLNAIVLIPGDAFIERVDKPDQHKGSGQLRVELGAFRNAAGNDGRDRRSKGQQEEKAGDVVAALLGDLRGADEEVGAVGHGKTDGKVGHGGHGEVGQNFDQGIDLVLFADSTNLQEGKAGMHGKHHNGAE